MDSHSNNEIIHALIRLKFIKTMEIEKVFRSVDRRLYLTNDDEHNPYRCTLLDFNCVHLYVPSFYAKALECLELKSGNKFLNIGSGSGYFNTLVGLLLGTNGINHGIEINQLLIDCAHQKLEEFKLNSAAIDYYDFCEPVFIQGNVCEMLPMGFYDKVYCGAEVPDEQSQFMMSLIKVGGILVMPLSGSFVKITRKDEHIWKTVSVKPKTFYEPITKHIVESEDFCSVNSIRFPPVEPLSLQKLCRSSIRSLLRENLKNISPNLQMRTFCPLKYNDLIIKNLHSAQTSDELTKRKLPKAGCSELNERGTESEIEVQNPNTMALSLKKMESIVHAPPLHYVTGKLWISVFFDALVQEEDSNGVPSIDDEDNGFFDTLITFENVAIITAIKAVEREMMKYCFITERKENKLSKLLKDKINLLPIPIPLKDFLNYNKVD